MKKLILSILFLASGLFVNSSEYCNITFIADCEKLVMGCEYCDVEKTFYLPFKIKNEFFDIQNISNWTNAKKCRFETISHGLTVQYWQFITFIADFGNGECSSMENPKTSHKGITQKNTIQNKEFSVNAEVIKYQMKRIDEAKYTMDPQSYENLTALAAKMSLEIVYKNVK